MNSVEMRVIGDTPEDMGEMGVDVASSQKTQALQNTLRLKHPIKIDGRETHLLQYDFDELTAKDLHEASKYLKGLGIPVSVPALDWEYQLVIFAKAVKKVMQKVDLFDLMRLKAADAMAATGLARSFLLDMDPAQKELGSLEKSEE